MTIYKFIVGINMYFMDTSKLWFISFHFPVQDAAGTVTSESANHF